MEGDIFLSPFVVTGEVVSWVVFPATGLTLADFSPRCTAHILGDPVGGAAIRA